MTMPISKVKTVLFLLFVLFLWAGMAWAGGFPGGHRGAFGPNFHARPPEQLPIPREKPPKGSDPLTRARYWNEIALDTNAIDHTPVEEGESRVFGEQFGPCRTSRALAIVHIAIFDAVNGIDRGYRSYSRFGQAPPQASMDAAIARAAHDTLVSLYPSQADRLHRLLADDLERIPDGLAKRNGICLGARSAAAILKRRLNDGSEKADPLVNIEFITSDQPGKWRQDPISEIPVAVGAYWGDVKPFVLRSADQFALAPPPLLASSQYTDAFNEVKRVGGDGITTPTERTEDQTIAGIFWAYDKAPHLGAPPRQYNQIAVQIADEQGSDAVEFVRLLALVNVAAADAAICSWYYKYYYQFWRPIHGIREADVGTGPTGLGDGNPETVGDPDFYPLGAPASNQDGPNFSPPFPAYPSGHAAFGGVLFEILRQFYGTDNIAFTFMSDEYNGVTTDNLGNIRPLLPRTYATFTEAEEENGQSRVYLGVHWEFDTTAGIKAGQQVAGYVMRHAFQKRRRPESSEILFPVLRVLMRPGMKVDQRGDKLRSF